VAERPWKFESSRPHHRAGAAALALLLLGATPADPIVLGPIRAQLLYQYSGRLSGNIAPPARVSLWNTGAGEGDVREPATDLLVTVPVTMPPADMAVFAPRPLGLSVLRERSRQPLARRSWAAGTILVPVAGTTHAQLFVRDVQCAGPILIEARYGTQTRRAALDFACGE
jgi:hypothetical protein